MILEDFMLSEFSQTQKIKGHMISLVEKAKGVGLRS